jgi:ABC-2 type transport system ATP-binding protein
MTEALEPQAVPITEPGIVLAVRGLRRAYGSLQVIDGLDLTVRRGEVYGFLGRNGAGKTTTIRALMGILKSDGGEIELLGSIVRRPRPEHKRQIGYVAQEQHFYPWMTCKSLARFVRGFYPSWDDRELARLFDAFELPANRHISALSHGMRVKLALAIAIAPRPPLLILDEPTAGLDPVARREFLDLVEVHARRAGQTVFFSTHLMDEVERLADRVGILDRGRLIYEGSLEVLRASVRAIGELPAEGLPFGFEPLQRTREGEVMVRASPEAWGAHPLGQIARRLPLDEIFIALVSRVRDR